ncbi:hypothetical protein [Alloscardovia macacae]|uniref:Uncharacterized protein n=1 Tax=Alloscardovia macacae TaxID=1160091 RepID=A0A261F1M9_9BIFI|nr:hypothetical protein [Alloscardovia macacae]OZG53030.1 hypothetical protein ALMA_1332 [Alloscardovia macacae]
MTTNAEKLRLFSVLLSREMSGAARSLLREEYIDHHVTDGTDVDAFVKTMKHFSGGAEKARMTFLRVFERGWG